MRDVGSMVCAVAIFILLISVADGHCLNVAGKVCQLIFAVDSGFVMVDMEGMEQTPQQIEWAAAKAGLTMKQVLTDSGISSSVWHSAKRGDSKMRPLTVSKLVNAIAARSDDLPI